MHSVVSFLPHYRRGLSLANLGVGLVVLLSIEGPARAERRPLPPALQAEVNRRIDIGVAFLRSMQGIDGSWAAEDKPHRVGYAALPGLTMMECGVSSRDPAIQRAANFVRREVLNTSETYELALSILFLDHLGEARDRRLIQALALRLIAGQTATGGWGYKCPELTSTERRDLLTALKRLRPKLPPLEAVAQAPAPRPDRKGDPLGPGVARRPDGRNLDPLTADGRRPGLEGSPASPTESTSGSKYIPPEERSKPQASPTSAASGGSLPGLDDPSRKEARKDAGDRKKEPVQEPRKEARVNKKPAPPPAQPEKPFVIPDTIRHLPVVQDPKLHRLLDPDKRDHETYEATTDNSNTQFAMLALWTAQRYDIPMDRCLKLITRRFETSQNADGSWGYRYSNGGNSPAGPPMTCVGLIGLAVGQGNDAVKQQMERPRFVSGLIALIQNRGKPIRPTARGVLQHLHFMWDLKSLASLHGLPTVADRLCAGVVGLVIGPGQGQGPVRKAARIDPRVASALRALSQHIGNPVNRIVNIDMQNLYFMWSVERTAVLYDLPLIVDKDWYRWGVEVLLANQKPGGFWDNKEMYPGADLPIDTSLALLFLKKANLLKTLKNQLRPEDIMDALAKKPAPPAEPPVKPEPISPITRAPSPPAPSPPQAPPRLDPPPPAPVDASVAETVQQRRFPWWLLLLLLIGVLALGGSGLLLFLHFNRQNEEEEKPVRPRPSRPRKKVPH